MGIVIDSACGPEPDPYDYYISFFHNNLPQKNDYQPFYFNGYTIMNGYNDDIEENQINLEQVINAKEWAHYFGKTVKFKDVQKAMYKLDDSVESALYNKFLIFGKLPDSLKHNTFLRKITSEKEKPSLHYYLFAEGIEHLINLRDDKWDPKPVDSVAVDKKAREAFSLANKEHDKFLRLRYYYQTQRLYHYSKNNRMALKIHKDYISKIKSDSHVIGWALCYKAGEEWKMGMKNEAAYLFSQIFAKYPERRLMAYHDFLNTNAPLDQVFKLCKNNQEKGIIYAIKGFHTPHIGLEALKNVYKTDPKSAMIGILLGREINKIEEGYLTPRTNGNGYYDNIGYDDHSKYDSVKNTFIKYIPKLKAFCEQLANEGKYPEPELGKLASAYLSWIKKDTVGGFKALAEINNEQLRPKLADEKQMIKLLLLTQSITKLDTNAENKLLPSLNWLDKKVKEERNLKNLSVSDWSTYGFKYYSASARDFYVKLLAPMYFKQHDTAMAALCILKSERTIYVKTITKYYPDRGLGFAMPEFWRTELNSKNLNKILALEKSKQKSAYLSRLTTEFREPITQKTEYDMPYAKGGYYYKAKFTILKNDLTKNIYDLMGTAYLREHKYEEAIEAYEHINTYELTRYTSIEYDYHFNNSKPYYRYPIVFSKSLKDYTRKFSKKKLKGYNKLDFAIRMAKLEKLVKTDPKNASKYYYDMANGLYNTSYYGMAWFYAAYRWRSEDIYLKDRYYYDKDYLHEHTAESLFLKAEKLSRNNEFKAKCIFMAAKCRQKKIKIPEDAENQFVDYKLGADYHPNNEGKLYNRAIRQNPYFKVLKNQYAITKFYKTAINECSYFRDFLGTTSTLSKK